MNGSNEIGKELLAHELTEKTVVVLMKVGRPAVTLWVSQVGSDFVAFYGGIQKITMFLKRNPDGTLEDDTPARVKVYEYLGDV